MRDAIKHYNIFMVTDYKSVWIKWVAMMQLELKSRREMLALLHTEVTKGFDVITKIAAEEIEGNISDKENLKTFMDAVEEYIAFSVYGGYMFFLITHSIDPQAINLLAQESTNGLGGEWVRNYDADMNKSLLEKIDPILSLIMEKETQEKMNRILVEFRDLAELKYKDMNIIETFINWSAHQGYILGMLENELSSLTTQSSKSSDNELYGKS